MADKIRVGLIGVNWGGRMHVPAIRAVPEMELAAVCTSRPETAQAASERFRIPRAFHDVQTLAADPDIDVISVATRAPLHYDMVLAALRGGKHVFCEWPLVRSAREAQEIVSLASQRGLRTVIGTQAYGVPALMYLKSLMGEGYVGQPLFFDMALFGGGVFMPTPSARAWTAQLENGVDGLTIGGSHAMAVVRWFLGEMESLSAEVRTLVPQWTLSDTGGTVEVTSVDNAAIVCRMQNGMLGSIHVSRAARFGGGFRFEVYGTEGKLAVTAPGAATAMMGHTLVGARNGAPEEDLTIPDRFKEFPGLTPDQPHFNVATLFRNLALAIQQGKEASPNFEDALRLHQIIDATHAAARSRQWVPVA